MTGNNKFVTVLALAFVLCLGKGGICGAADGRFVPEQPIMAPSELKAGESGYLLTVLQGTEPTKIPVRIMSVVPQKGEVTNMILVQLMPTKNPRAQELASGMSGSPVFVRGKLVGAIRQGWNFSGHKLAYATPIGEMCRIFAREAPAASAGLASRGSIMLSEPVAIAGLSQSAALNLAQSLGTTLAEGPAASSEQELLVEQNPSKAKLKPGDAVSALLAWGDVEVASTGTVTATAADGRFLAFGHSFLRRGNVGYPAARSLIHETVYSQSFPFKIASPVSLVGTITQDREAGIGGQTGFFAPSISASLAFKDKDTGTRVARRFRVVANQNITAKILGGIYKGLLDDSWGRTGEGTMAVTLRIDGKNLENGWARSDIFYSDSEISTVALKQAELIMTAFLTQPFENNMPLGFHIEVEATQEPFAMLIEDVAAPEKANAGEEIKVAVTLRPWRGKPVKREFALKVPKDAGGECELLVRGGSSQPMSQLAVEGGWLAIDSQERLLNEIKALDAGNELILDLQCDPISAVLSSAKSAKSAKAAKSSEKDSANKPKIGSENLSPEEREYLSETKERRIREGTLKIFKTDRFIDGALRRIITVEPRE